MYAHVLPAYTPHLLAPPPSGYGHFLGTPPRSVVRRYQGPRDTLREMAEHVLSDQGERSMLVRAFTEWVVREVRAKDYLGQILAIRNSMVQYSPWLPGVALFNYANDPRHVEMVKYPERMVREIMQHGTCVSDCFPAGTLLLRDDYELIPIEHATAGTKIWGLDRWSTVEGAVYKGLLDVDAVFLNNGSVVHLTPDHHVLVGICREHERWIEKPCSCREQEREWVRKTVGELEPNMVLPQPSRLPFGVHDVDPDRAYVEGLYVSDGWSSGNSQFSISGQDGCPKEEQKREVQRICERLGVRTTWYRKSIAVLDKDWTLRMHQMGHHAPGKHLLSLNLGEAAAAATLRGVMADSGKNTNGPGRTFTTTSRLLAVQTRVLQRMFAVSCGHRYIVHHGGLVQNPIWRLNTRAQRSAHGKSEKLLRVKSVERAVQVIPCYDITTDDHHVYLPEHDVTVQNCDDTSVMAATMCLQVGRNVELIAMGFAPNSLSHVAVRCQEPKSNKWILLDGVAGPREREAAGRAKELLVWSLD